MLKWYVKGRLIGHSDSKYKIDWTRKAPSKGSQIVKDFLYEHCRKHLLFEEYRVPKTRVRADFLDANLKIVIEYDCKEKKGHHNSFNKFFHRNKIGFLNSIKRDFKKQEFFENNGYKVIRIYEEDLKNLSPQWFKEKFDVDIY